MKKRVADIVVETLVGLNIRECFCVVGGGAMHLNNAFEINSEMNITFCHHEQTYVHLQRKGMPNIVEKLRWFP